MPPRARTRLYAAVLPLCAALTPLHASFTSYYFVGPNNSLYSDPANWSPSPNGPGGSPPGNDDYAYVQPNTFRQITVDAAPNNAFLQVASFTGPSAIDALIVNVNTTTLSQQHIAFGPNAIVHHTAGDLRAGDATVTGPATTYSLSGTASLYGTAKVSIANGASFNQSGGFVTSSNAVSIGGGSLATSYALSAGTVGGDDLLLDGPAPVSFTQTGGNAGGYYSVVIGRNASYSLAAGTLSSSYALQIGGKPYNATTSFPDAGSTLTQTGGSVLIGDSAPALLVNSSPDSSALYAMSGGTLSSPYARGITIGDTTTGTFLQSGGTVGPTPSTIPLSLTLGTSAGSNGYYSLSNAASLNAGSLRIADAGSATFAQSGGTVALSSLTLASAPSSSATYSLSAGSISVSSPTPSTFTIADSGIASFTQSGGSIGSPGSKSANATPAFLYLANAAGSSASYSLSGAGTLYAGWEYLANSGSASFTQSGGSHSTQSTLFLAYAAGSSATYALSAGSLTPALLHVAESGSATLNQSGGSLTTASLTLANNPGSNATLNLTGGTLTILPPNPIGTSALGAAGNAAVYHSAGTLSNTTTTTQTILAQSASSTSSYSLSGTGSLLAYSLVIADSGSASFNQSGGSVSLTSSLTLARSPGSTATYTMTDGSLYAPSISVGTGATGASANFAQYGGSASFGTLSVSGTPAAPARYAVGPTSASSPPGLTYPSLSVGDALLDGPGPSRVIINYGSASFSTIHVGRNGDFFYGSGTSNFHVDDSIVVGGTPPGASGSYADAGATFTLDSFRTFLGDIAGDEALTVNSSPNSTATFILHAGQLLFNARNPVTIGNTTTGTVVQTGGSFGSSISLGPHTQPLLWPTLITLGKSAGSAGSYSLSNGYLVTDALLAGDAGSATFTQTGGYASADALTLASQPGSSASFSLAGGTLTAKGAAVGGAGTATFTQTAGTFTASSSLILSAPSSYSLAGGSLSTPFLRTFGNFSQSNGQLSTGKAYVETGATNTYALSGGTLAANELDVLGPSNSSLAQTGGTLTATSLLVGRNGAYSLTAGSLTATTLNLTNDVWPGSDNTFFTNRHSVLEQSGGSVTAPTLLIAPSSTYDLTAGSLSSHSITNNGTLFMLPPASLTLTGPSPTLTNTGSLTLAGPQSWPANSTLTNTLVAFLHSDPGPTLNFSSASPDWAPVVFDAPATHLASLILTSTTHATLAPAAAYLSTPALTIQDTAQLDLTTSTLLTSTSPDTLRQYLLAARLTSSSADATHRLGYLTDATATRVTLTLTGDANLDGKLNADDYALLDRGYARHLTTWQSGDFNYDGTINNQDYLLIDSTLAQQQGGHLAPDFLSQRESQFGASYVSALLAAVPEPTSLACLVATLPLFRRRRTR